VCYVVPVVTAKQTAVKTNMDFSERKQTGSTTSNTLEAFLGLNCNISGCWDCGAELTVLLLHAWVLAAD
jgi:hypothetical protein